LRALRLQARYHAVKWKRAFYGLPGLGWIIEIAPYDVSVNVFFLGGADCLSSGHSSRVSRDIVRILVSGVMSDVYGSGCDHGGGAGRPA
jgi:hypothetical protein